LIIYYSYYQNFMMIIDFFFLIIKLIKVEKAYKWSMFYSLELSLNAIQRLFVNFFFFF